MTTRVSEGPLRDRVRFRKGPWGDTLPLSRLSELSTDPT